MSRHIGVTQRKMREQARNFFAPKGDVEKMLERGDAFDREVVRAIKRGEPRAATDPGVEAITRRQRVEAMKKLLSYPAPLKDLKAAKKMKRAMELPVFPDGIPNYNVVKDLRDTNIADLVSSLGALNEKLAKYERRKADVRGEIQLLVELAQIPSVIVDKWIVTRTEGRRASEKIDRKKLGRQLMKRGFTADDVAVIVNSSIIKGKPGKPTIVVTDTSKPRGRKVADE